MAFPILLMTQCIGPRFARSFFCSAQQFRKLCDYELWWLWRRWSKIQNGDGGGGGGVRNVAVTQRRVFSGSTQQPDQRREKKKKSWWRKRGQTDNRSKKPEEGRPIRPGLFSDRSLWAHLDLMEGMTIVRGMQKREDVWMENTRVWLVVARDTTLRSLTMLMMMTTMAWISTLTTSTIVKVDPLKPSSIVMNVLSLGISPNTNTKVLQLILFWFTPLSLSFSNIQQLTAMQIFMHRHQNSVPRSLPEWKKKFSLSSSWSSLSLSISFSGVSDRTSTRNSHFVSKTVKTSSATKHEL